MTQPSPSKAVKSGKTQAARLAVLRDVVRSGGVDRWPHLHSHGHHFSSVKACVARGDLTRIRAYHYAITKAGLAALDAAPPSGEASK